MLLYRTREKKYRNILKVHLRSLEREDTLCDGKAGDGVIMSKTSGDLGYSVE
jgi:hypothetical protein